MNILVTGGSGFIGSHVVDKLAEDGHKVRILDLTPPHRQDIDSQRGDITSREDLRRSLLNVDVVYHIAAFSNIDLVKSNPLTTIEQNILGTAYLLEECRTKGIKHFILASSVYAYGERGHLYTTSKIASELLCKNYHTLYSLPYTILRYGTAYGPRSRGADVISILVQRALHRQNLIIHGSGEQTRHFIYVEDLAFGNIAALKPIAKNKTYTLAGRQPASINQLAQTIRSLFDNQIAIEYAPAREDDYQERALGISNTMRELQWKPKVSLEEGIRRYIEWYKANVGKQ